jgi:hypothetical protein
MGAAAHGEERPGSVPAKRDAAEIAYHHGDDIAADPHGEQTASQREADV